MRFRRNKRLKSPGQSARPPFAERMRRFNQHPKKPQWWAMVAGVVAICGLVGWALV